MNEPSSLLRLMALLSPTFPTGGFAYSSGLEAAIEGGVVRDENTLETWLNHSLTNGSLWNDAVLFAAAWRAKPDGLPLLAETGLALSSCQTRFDETKDQASAFIEAAKPWLSLTDLPSPCPLSVAIGSATSRLGIDLHAGLAAFLQAQISNQLQAALRLMALGQVKATGLLARLEAPILITADRAQNSCIEDLGTANWMMEIATMKHETLPSRIFRS